MLIQQIVNGLMLGSIYVLIAVAFTLAIGILNFLNFSIPGLFMLGGMLLWAVVAAGLPWTLGLFAGLAAAAVVALLVERLAYRNASHVEPEVPLVSSLGFLILLENGMLVAFGSDQQSFPAIFGDLNLRIGGLVIGGAQLISLAVSLALVIWLSIFLNRSNTGRRLRAIAENRETALLLGIPISRLVPLVFVGSALFTALGGALFTINYLQASPFMGETVGFKGIAAVIIGGMGSVWGAVLGGLLIGLSEVLTIGYIGANLVDVVVYGVLLVLLIIRPRGLLGQRSMVEKL